MRYFMFLIYLNEQKHVSGSRSTLLSKIKISLKKSWYKKKDSRITFLMHLLTLKRFTLHFTNPLVNVALKFYEVNLPTCNFKF